HVRGGAAGGNEPADEGDAAGDDAPRGVERLGGDVDVDDVGAGLVDHAAGDGDVVAGAAVDRVGDAERLLGVGAAGGREEQQRHREQHAAAEPRPGHARYLSAA